MASDNDLIAVASLLSSIVAFVVSSLLLYDWKRTEKQQRLEWGIGMFTYAIGHFIVFILYSLIIPEGNDVQPLLWIYVNLGGAITMALILKGILPLFTEKPTYIYGIPIGYALLYGVGSYLYAFVLPEDTLLNFIMLGELLDKPYTQNNNMSWYVVELLIPASFVLAFLFIMHFRETQALSSLLISIHFFGYALLLFVWPFDDFKLLFYSGRTLITTIMALGFVDLIRRT